MLVVTDAPIDPPTRHPASPHVVSIARSAPSSPSRLSSNSNRHQRKKQPNLRLDPIIVSLIIPTRTGSRPITRAFRKRSKYFFIHKTFLHVCNVRYGGVVRLHAALPMPAELPRVPGRLLPQISNNWVLTHDKPPNDRGFCFMAGILSVDSGRRVSLFPIAPAAS